MSSMTVSEARSALPEIVDRVNAGEEVTLTRHGLAVAVIVRPDTLRSRRAELGGAATVREVLARGRRSPLAVTPSVSGERADELIAEVRAARQGR
jgi:prevent-host-death family protein